MGYIFQRGNESNFIVGSSNLTQEALTKNHEWNIKINSINKGSLTQEIENEFEETWANVWMTRSRVRWDSKEAVDIRNQAGNGLKLHLFIKKKDGESRDHYYLGELNYIDMVETTIADKKGDGKELPIVNIQFELDVPVREDVYDYLVKG
jgi:hypothetical protein